MNGTPGRAVRLKIAVIASRKARNFGYGNFAYIANYCGKGWPDWQRAPRSAGSVSV